MVTVVDIRCYLDLISTNLMPTNTIRNHGIMIFCGMNDKLL